jgi:SAM-dependent methyltransferase
MPDCAFLPARYEVVECSTVRLAAELSRVFRRGTVPLNSSPGRNDRVECRAYEVSHQLKTLGLTLPVGKAIDFGCGSGRDARWLAKNGWHVVAIDRHAELERYFQLQSVEFICDDLSTFTDSRTFDLAIVHFTWFEGILEKVCQTLRHGGVCSLLVHSDLHFRCFGSPKIKVEIPKKLTVEQMTEFWTMDRHVSAFVLRRNSG